jgi:hypothetical protein
MKSAHTFTGSFPSRGLHRIIPRLKLGVKLPIVFDLPTFGRSRRSSVENHDKIEPAAGRNHVMPMET